MKSEKLTKTGNWYWRDNEINYKDFCIMDRASKFSHIDFLKSLPIQELGTNDEYILNLFDPTYLRKVNKNFLSIDEEIINEQVEVDIDNLSKEDIREILVDTFFDYPNWEWDLKATTPIKFINGIKNLGYYSKLLEQLIMIYIK